MAAGRGRGGETRRRAPWIVGGALLLGAVAAIPFVLTHRAESPVSMMPLAVPAAASPRTTPSSVPSTPPPIVHASTSGAAAATVEAESVGPGRAHASHHGARAPSSPTLGGKPVVVDYDGAQGSRAALTASPGVDDKLVERARKAYRRGNDSLFAGQADKAIAAYGEALQIYPGYVAGYRGTGLALAQQGKTAAALEALQTYLRAAPSARDAAMVKRRIRLLEKGAK